MPPRRLCSLLVRRPERLDVLGSVLATAALALAVFGIVDANNVGWASTQTVAVLGGAIALLGAFVASQALVREPLVPLGIFRVRNLTGANPTFSGSGVPVYASDGVEQPSTGRGTVVFRTTMPKPGRKVDHLNPQTMD